MIRTLFSACLLSLASFTLVMSGATGQQPSEKKQPAKGKFDPPEALKPDEATLKVIQEKTEQLRKAIAELKAKHIPDHFLIVVEIYLKAAENIVRFEEWYAKDSVTWALTTLDRGLHLAKQVAPGGAFKFEKKYGEILRQNTSGKWMVLAYRSKIDDSIQPYAVLLPDDYGKDPNKLWPLDVILHGRDSSLTEAKFIATHDGKPGPKGLDRILLEVYGRGNNAYRWAGETDVLEAMVAVGYDAFGEWGTSILDDKRVVLRGFSMGGGGTWHLGLHHPEKFCAIGPGAGFTTTHGYIGGLPAKLPDYQEKCLHIYDAVDYAENAFNIPVIAYSGENDEQKAAADNIEKLLKGFKEPVRFTHLIAPGLKHEQPKEWLDKAEAEYKKFRDKGRNDDPERIRFVTYTPRFYGCDWLWVYGLEKSYEKAVVDASRKRNTFTISTTNVREFSLGLLDFLSGPISITVDGQKIAMPGHKSFPLLVKKDGKWSLDADHEADYGKRFDRRDKHPGLTGPIDDAFHNYFWVVGPTEVGWHPATEKHAKSAIDEFARTWDKYFRGKLPMGTKVPQRRSELVGTLHPHLVLFGDPESNPKIAEILPKLPITWTKEKLVVNGVDYDSKTHLPVLIYPNPLTKNRNYIVLNSGHTFGEADLKGSNALLYPRLGDWAVIKPTPTAKDPAAYEVVAAGLFDENWQFPKK